MTLNFTVVDVGVFSCHRSFHEKSADYTRYISSIDVYRDGYETATIHNEEYGQHALRSLHIRRYFKVHMKNV